ncbi:hypothetical protein ACRPK8_01700 [Exiguobacterium sp. TDN 0502]|uniref:hypothetical protein n=1 Tax=Exiguobacterium sp. TDN 0502 TaxID=3420731 RepID=UPI003D7715A2
MRKKDEFNVDFFVFEESFINTSIVQSTASTIEWNKDEFVNIKLELTNHNNILQELNEKILAYVSTNHKSFDDYNLELIYDNSKIVRNSYLILLNEISKKNNISFDEFEELQEWFYFEQDYLNDLITEEISNTSISIIQSKNLMRSFFDMVAFGLKYKITNLETEKEFKTFDSIDICKNEYFTNVNHNKRNSKNVTYEYIYSSQDKNIKID